MFKVDHSKGESTFEQIKPGEYEAIVINYEQKESSTKKNMVVVDYEIRSDVDISHAKDKKFFSITSSFLKKLCGDSNKLR